MPWKAIAFLRAVRDAVDVTERICQTYQLGKRILNDKIPRKVHAVRIPTCRGYFQREEEKEIRRKLKSLCKNGNVCSVKTLILHGPIGHGKEYSAANLMNERLRSSTKLLNLRERPAILWTINANSQATMLESYCSLAKEIGLTEEAKVANQELSLLSRTSQGRQYQVNLQNQCQKNAYDVALKQIYEEVMKNLRHHSPWVLLIRDASEDMHSRFWPQPGDPNVGNGLVVITTQFPKLLTKEGDDHSLEKVLIGKMKNEDAVKFLAAKSGIPAIGADKTYAQQIVVKKLMCNPQDIAKFGGFIREHIEATTDKLTYEELWSLMETETATFSECMLIMEMNRENQAELLKFMACCSSDHYTPLKIVEAFFQEAAEAAKESKFVEISVPEEVKVVNIHKREHALLRDLLIRQEQSPAEQSNHSWYRRLLGNNASDISTPKLSGRDVSKVIKCLSSIVKDALQHLRDEDFAMLRLTLPHLKEAVKLSSELPEEELEPLSMANGHACLGEGLLYFGESAQSEIHLKTALRLFKNYKGLDNVQLELANVLHFLGEAYSNSNLGDPLTGEKYLRDALREKLELCDGRADPQVAFTLHSLGNVLNELGKHSEAINHIKRARDIYLESGNYKQEYGFTLSALGSSYRYRGQYVQAEDCLKKALKTFRTVHSPSNLRIGLTLSRLSSVQRNLDKLDESIDSLNEALTLFWYNDTYRAVILSKLSVVYRYKGDSKQSLYYAEKVKEISDQQHGTKDHPALATALLNLGHAQSDTGDVEDGVRNLTKAKKIYVGLHGKNHRSVAATHNYLAYAYQQQGKLEKAKEELEWAVEILMEQYSPLHPERANSLKRLSKTCLILGESIKSADLAFSALQGYKNTYGNNMEHREVRKCTVRVAYACSKIALFDVASEYLREVELGFPLENKTHPEFAAFLQKKTEITLDSLEITSSWHLDCPKVQEMFCKADTDLVRAEEILSNSLGRNHNQHALIKKEIARLKLLMGCKEIAYDQILSALKLLIPNVSNHLKAEFLLIRSDAAKELGLNRAQKECLEEAETIYRQTFGDNHSMVVFTLQKLCTAYLDLENTQTAYKYFIASEKACGVLKTNLKEQLDNCHSDFLKNYNINTHPIVKRQQLLVKRMTRNHCAW